MKRLCVFCGAAVGAKPLYVEQALLVGRVLAERSLIDVTIPLPESLSHLTCSFWGGMGPRFGH